ncbi:hypothetical protein GQ44DRAFT_716223 [Phaeosphaeriaceae sp. PMI808]|nr:hypothetical protein GQ44DRAFT_716223 [Phaeosphaeriaceae sp. PMI808]
MTISSRSQIIQSEPIGDGLDTFRRFLRSNYEDVSTPSVLNTLDKGNIYKLPDFFFTSTP